jgi:negative regulator of sigma E activity
MSSDFEKRAREILDESADRLDGRTRSRLTQARHAALSRGDKPAREAWRSWLPAGVAAAAVLATAVWMVQPERIAPVAGNGSALEDIDLLADAEAPDFVSDPADLEFYEWAAGEVES